MADTRQLNTYTFQNLRALRAALRHYRSLELSASDGDFTSAAMLLDLNRSLGMLNGEVCAVSRRQRIAITLLLIEGGTIETVARQMGIVPRTLRFIVQAGLIRVRKYLQDGKNPRDWQPWQQDYVQRNLHLKPAVLAQAIGKTPHAVWNHLYRLRKYGEVIANRATCESASRSA
jgi:hypothetical protein